MRPSSLCASLPLSQPTLPRHSRLTTTPLRPHSVCLLFPSHLLTEPRESFLIRDHYSHVARPKHHFKTASPFKVSRAPEFVTGVVVVAWAVVCVCVAKLTDVLA